MKKLTALMITNDGFRFAGATVTCRFLQQPKKKYPCAFIVGVEIELHMVGESFDGLLLRAFAIGRDHGP